MVTYSTVNHLSIKQFHWFLLCPVNKTWKKKIRQGQKGNHPKYNNPSHSAYFFREMRYHAFSFDNLLKSFCTTFTKWDNAPFFQNLWGLSSTTLYGPTKVLLLLLTSHVKSGHIWLQHFLLMKNPINLTSERLEPDVFVLVAKLFIYLKELELKKTF